MGLNTTTNPTASERRNEHQLSTRLKNTKVKTIAFAFL